MRKLLKVLLSFCFITTSTSSTISCYFNSRDKFSDAQKIASVANITDKDFLNSNLKLPTYFSANLQRQLDDMFSEFFQDNKINVETQAAFAVNSPAGVLANEALYQISKKNSKLSWVFEKIRQQSLLFDFKKADVNNIQDLVDSLFVDLDSWIINATFLDEKLLPWELKEKNLILEETYSKPNKNLKILANEEPEEPEFIYYNIDLNQTPLPKYVRFNVLGKIHYNEDGTVDEKLSNPRAIQKSEEGNILKFDETYFSSDFGVISQGIITTSKPFLLSDINFDIEGEYHLSPITLDYSATVFDFWNNISFIEQTS
ncbi:hypothetical protein SSABA_v1c03280 [Spiroplasma sabaudiense Ar-1343]|uniref:Lipoprotein n=1 Tax=Spiroplasma sabaudiense Ar-1343 TaxID=1276257 RepID=W6AJ52_9MOLU|nr:hypothetical protein [Spiroplasma sabaudiense]AHI53739.1 hypothetical protein SSABA_v1c03280 [Spiroplasma sabaudiense Ar-1343]